MCRHAPRAASRCAAPLAAGANSGEGVSAKKSEKGKWRSTAPSSSPARRASASNASHRGATVALHSNSRLLEQNA